jgi:hypothetical protein
MISETHRYFYQRSIRRIVLEVRVGLGPDEAEEHAGQAGAYEDCAECAVVHAHAEHPVVTRGMWKR